MHELLQRAGLRHQADSDALGRFPGPVRFQPPHFGQVLVSVECHPSVHGLLDQPVPVNNILLSRDHDVSRAAPVDAAVASRHRHAMRLVRRPESVCRQEKVVRVHTKASARVGHLNVVDEDLNLEATTDVRRYGFDSESEQVHAHKTTTEPPTAVRDSGTSGSTRSGACGPVRGVETRATVTGQRRGQRRDACGRSTPRSREPHQRVGPATGGCGSRSARPALRAPGRGLLVRRQPEQGRVRGPPTMATPCSTPTR